MLSAQVVTALQERNARPVRISGFIMLPELDSGAVWNPDNAVEVYCALSANPGDGYSYPTVCILPDCLYITRLCPAKCVLNESVLNESVLDESALDEQCFRMSLVWFVGRQRFR